MEEFDKIEWGLVAEYKVVFPKLPDTAAARQGLQRTMEPAIKARIDELEAELTKLHLGARDTLMR